MKHTKILSIAVFLLFAAFVWAQEPREESKPRQEEPSRQEEARPESNRDAAPPARQNEMKPPRQEEEKPGRAEKQENAQPPRDEAKPGRDQRGNERQPANERNGQAMEKGEPARSGQHARPAGKSAHIPDQKFKANYGRQHSFTVNRVINQTTIVAGQTQFVYGGYTFVFLDPWPADWLFTDDVYIDYVDDDYFLFDLLHPGIRIALFVQG